MYIMVSLCSNLLLSGESMHGHATFYSKLNVSYIKPTHIDEAEVLLPYAEFKNCIRSIPRTASDPAFCDYPQDPASPHMFQMFFDMLSLFILV